MTEVNTSISTTPWIRVEDRLPDPNEWVLVVYGRARAIKMYENGIWYDGETYCYCPLGQVEGVTHWMPLPELPEVM